MRLLPRTSDGSWSLVGLIGTEMGIPERRPRHTARTFTDASDQQLPTTSPPRCGVCVSVERIDRHAVPQDPSSVRTCRL